MLRDGIGSKTFLNNYCKVPPLLYLKSRLDKAVKPNKLRGGKINASRMYAYTLEYVLEVLLIKVALRPEMA